MSVTIKMDQILRQYTDSHETVEVNGSTVRECLDDLIRQFPDTKRWLYDKNGILMVMILMNGDTVYQKDLDRPVSDGDELHVIIIIGGG